MQTQKKPAPPTQQDLWSETKANIRDGICKSKERK